MPETFEYTKSWLSEEDFPLLGFTRNWENPSDYPTYEPDEAQVRKDMQSLHDEVKDYLNDTLIPRVLAADATEEGRDRAEAARESAETERAAAEQGRISAEQERLAAETQRISDENARITAEQERADADSVRKSNETARQDAETLRDAKENERIAAELERIAAEELRRLAEQNRASAETNRAAAETGRAAAETARADAEDAREAAEQARADETAGIVARATVQADAAAQSATEAKTAETAAEKSAADAKTSETAAEKSATDAKTAETAAEQSAAAAKVSENNAKSSETAAKTSETQAKNSETNAKTSETRAKASETAAAKSATAAAESAASMTESVAKSEAAATAAAQSATEAKAAETAAEQSAAAAAAAQNAAQESLTHAPYIGEDRYWYVWDATQSTYVNTNIFGEGVSGVFVGSGDMPVGYNVQIDPAGTAANILRVKDDAGNIIPIPAIQGEDGETITSITRTAGTGKPGTDDTYTITTNLGKKYTFKVHNGRDGGMSEDEVRELVAEAAPQADWNQNDETQPDYVKNRPGGYEISTEIQQISETTLAFEEREDMPGVFASVEVPSDDIGSLGGDRVKLVFDGVEYLLYGEYTLFGNGSLWGDWLEDTGEDFLVHKFVDIEFYESSFTVRTRRPGTEHTIELYSYDTEVVKLPEKYLPDSAFEHPDHVKSDWSENTRYREGYVLNRTHYVEYEAGEDTLLEEIEIEVPDGETYVHVETPLSLELGKAYTFLFDWNEYFCETWKGDYDDALHAGQGDLAGYSGYGNSAPFCIDCSEDGFYLYVENGPGTYYLTIRNAVETVHKLDAKFLPDDISGLPDVSAADNGKFLRVVSGQWSVATVRNAKEVAF